MRKAEGAGATGELVVWRRAASLPYQKLDDEILVVDPRTRSVHLLSATATRVWELLESARSAEGLLSDLCGEYDAPREVIRGDLARLLADLQGRGLVGPDEAVAGRSPAGTVGEGKIA